MKQFIIKALGLLPNHKFLFSSIWTLIIIYLSLGKISTPDSIELIPFSDKIVHFFMYLILCLLLQMEFQNTAKKNITVLIMLYSIFIGGFMEILQAYIFTYRTGDYFDMFFNILGTLSSIVPFSYYKKIIKK